MIALRVVFSRAARRSTVSRTSASRLMLIFVFRAMVVPSILLIIVPAWYPHAMCSGGSHLRAHRLLDGADELVGGARHHLDRLRVVEDGGLKRQQLSGGKRLAACRGGQQGVHAPFGAERAFQQPAYRRGRRGAGHRGWP